MKKLNMIKNGGWMCGLALLLAGCMKDGTELPGDGPRPGDALTVNFYVDDTDEVQIATRTTDPSSSEKSISSLVMLVYDSAGKLIFSQTISSSALFNKDGNTWSTEFIPDGSFSSSNKIVFVANSDFVGGADITQINMHSSIEPYNGLCAMFGETNWASLQNTAISPVRLYRSIAKVQVNTSELTPDKIFDESVVFDDFDSEVEWEFGNYLPLEKGDIYHSNYSRGAPVGLPVKAAEADFSLHTGTYYKVMSFSEDYGDFWKIGYLPAYPNATYAKQKKVERNTFDKNRTCIVLCVPTKTGEKVYYRLDFSTQNRETTEIGPSAENEFVDIAPNTHYIFNITRVRSRGYATIEEALANPGSNIEYTITDDNSAWESMTSNGQYAVKTDCRICDVVVDKTEANDLLKFAAQLPDAGQKPGGDLPTTVETRTVRLVGADKSTTTPVSEMQLCTADGAAISGNTWNFSGVSNADLTAGYQLKYKTTSAFPTNACYVEITYGNIKHYVPVRRSVFTVETTNTDFPYTGGTRSFLVKSYSTVGASTQQEMPWTSSMISDDGDSSWATFPSGGTGSGIISCTVRPDDPERFNVHDYTLQRTTPAGHTVDLSTIGSDIGMETTANCYIVNASGTYSLPLVYGNALKNGNLNLNALYNSAVSSSDQIAMRNVYNSADVIFDEPAIPLDGGRFGQAAVKDAVLIWQDAENLVTAISINRNSSPWPSLTFIVSSKYIKQGNAVIGIRDVNNKIMWSWHIWVTDYKLGSGIETVTNLEGKQYKIMPLNLGWCYGDHLKYKEGKLNVTFTQAETGLKQTVSIKRLPYEMDEPGGSPYYQWGRKDPMPPYVFDLNRWAYVEKQVYVGSSGLAPTSATGPVSIGTAISNPNLFYTVTDVQASWYKASVAGKTTIKNLWNFISTSDSRQDKVVKTIYDPSPAGYCVPSSKAFTGFTDSGDTGQVSLNECNVSGIYDWGWNFYTQPHRKGNTIFFPGLIFLSNNSGKMAEGPGVPVSAGYYWLDSSPELDTGGEMLFDDKIVDPFEHPINSYGCPVRPMQEQE